MMHLARIAAGVLLFAIGLVGMIVAVVGVLDPAGSQLADDSAPFATPRPWYVELAILSAFLVGAVGGLWLVRSRVSSQR